MQFCLWRILLSGDIRNITSSQWSLSVLSEKKENQRFADFLGCTDVLSFLFSLMSWVRLVVFCITFFFLCPLHPTVLFLCILKKSANLWFSFFFREYRKRPVGWSELIGIRASHSSQSWTSITRQGLAARGKFIITDYLTEQLCNLLNCTTLEWWIVWLRVLRTFRNNRQEMFYKKKVFSNNLQNSQEIHRLQACNFTRKETPTQVFSCEFCEIFKNIFFMEHLQWLLLNLRILNFKIVYISKHD